MDLEIAVMSLSLERNFRIYSSVNTDSMMNDFKAYSLGAPFTHGLCSVLHCFTFELIFFFFNQSPLLRPARWFPLQHRQFTVYRL